MSTAGRQRAAGQTAVRQPSVRRCAGPPGCRQQGVLENANIILAGVAADIMGKSGRDILAALLAGSTDVEAMAELARGKARDPVV